MDYVALQVHTSYSMLSSLNSISLLVSNAINLGYKALAITDTNNMFGVSEFCKECKKNNIKPIIGIELDTMNTRLLLYAINNNGYKNLIKLSTLISERELVKEDLINYKDNLILIMPYSFFNEEIYNIYSYKYIGYSTIIEREQITDKKVLINDVRYLKKDDYKYLDYLQMIKEGETEDSYEFNTHINKHLLSEKEVNSLGVKEDIENTKEIADMCNVELTFTPNLLPIYDPNVGEYEYLKRLCNKGLQKRLNNNVSLKYQERLDYELDIIEKMGFGNYFLVVWDFVKYAKKNNILVGTGRGSAAGSLVSYTLGITDVDPMEYELLFERFLNPERITMPDIDIDFDAYKREDIINYVINKYGIKKVSRIITFNTLAAKQVVRDVSRVMNISLPLVDEVNKNITYRTLMDSYNNNPKFKNMINSSNDLKKMFDIALHLEGLPRHVGIHAAGIVMSNKDLDETIPLYQNELGLYVTGYSMDHLEELGLLKMDILALSNLTSIDNIINDIKEKEKLNITFNNIPMNDKKAIKLFNKADTDGIFQFESSGMKRFLRSLKANTFDDVIAAIALFRPGPSVNIDSYIKRKEGKEEIDYLHNDLKKVLEPTYGIIVYQEQIMQIANIMAGYSLGEADLLRRAMSKKKADILLQEESKFINRCTTKGYDEVTAKKVYDLILRFANYGFNKSHSVAYAIIAYKMAFLKVYFFKYFMSSLLTNAIGSETKTKTYMNEIRQNKIDILLPNINKSTNNYIVENKGIRCPLSIIRNVGNIASNEIIKERSKGEFTDFINFITRMYPTINKKVITSLIEASCFTDFGYNKQTLINNLDNIINYAELTRDINLLEIEKPEITIYEEYNDNELINIEYNIFGFYLNGHPVNKYTTNSSINSFLIKEFFGQMVELVIYCDKIKEIVTKKNDVMLFIDGSDEYGNIDLTVFPNIYKQYNNIKKGSIYRVVGKVEKRFDKYQIIVNKLEFLE